MIADFHLKHIYPCKIFVIENNNNNKINLIAAILIIFHFDLKRTMYNVMQFPACIKYAVTFFSIENETFPEESYYRLVTSHQAISLSSIYIGVLFTRLNAIKLFISRINKTSYLLNRKNKKNLLSR